MMQAMLLLSKTGRLLMNLVLIGGVFMVQAAFGVSGKGVFQFAQGNEHGFIARQCAAAQGFGALADLGQVRA